MNRFKLRGHRLVAVISLFVIISLVFSHTVFALYAQEQKLTASDGAADDELGTFVGATSDGSRVVISSPGDELNQGAVYIYSRSGTTWAEEQKLTASDGAASDRFGYAVSITADGTRLIVGAYVASASEGAAYVYSRSGTTWTEEQKLEALEDGAADELFGQAVVIDSDGARVAIGAPGDESNQGAVYVYSRSGTTWTLEQKVTASDGAATTDTFGNALDITDDGSRMISGAYSASAVQGAAYVFSRSGTTWTEEQKLTASDGAADDQFGISVGIVSADASRAVIGANGDNGITGAAYVFSRSGVTWTQEQKLTASDGALEDEFGRSVDITSDGARVVTGGLYSDNGAVLNQGGVYVYDRSGTTWTESEKLTASDGAADDRLGIAVAVASDGTRLVSGAYVDDIGANANQGSAYVFALASSATPTPAVGGSCFGSLTVGVSVNGGSATPADAHLFLDTSGMDRDFSYTLTCQTYQISAAPLTGYAAAYSGDCNTSGSVIVAAGTGKSCTVTFKSTATPSSTPAPTPSATPTPPASPASPSEFGLREGDVISAVDSSDPDLYIINSLGYKRLFLNPVIFSFYGHLGGWSVVKSVSASVRDAFTTSGLFRNCETGDSKVYALEPTGEDTGILHHVNMTGAQAVAEDPNFFSKVFCINSNEFNWYPKSPVPYTSLGQVPSYQR